MTLFGAIISLSTSTDRHVQYFKTQIKTKLTLEILVGFQFEVLKYVYTLFCILKIYFFSNWTNSNKSDFYVKLTELLKILEKITKWVRKSIHHYVLLWDKEIPHYDPNNLPETISDKLFCPSGEISMSHTNTYMHTCIKGTFYPTVHLSLTTAFNSQV